MWPFSSKRVAPRRVVVIDIGTDSVGCAVSSLVEKQSPQMLYSVRVPLVLANEPRTADRLLERVRTAARQAFDRTAFFTHRHAADIPVSHLRIILSAPWSSLYVRNLRFTSPEAARADKALFNQLTAGYVKRQRPDADETIIERSIADVRLDGSQVLDLPRRAAANRVELTALTSGAYTPLIHSVRDEAQRSFGIRPEFSFRNADAIYSRVLSAVQPSRNDFVLCNVGGEVTSLLTVRDHTPVGIVTMPRGSHLPLRTLMAQHQFSRDEAQAALALSLDDDAPLCDKMHAALHHSDDTYAKDFSASFTRIAPLTGSTPTLYTLGDSAGSRWSSQRIAQTPMFKSRYPLGLRSEHIDNAWLSQRNAVSRHPRCVPDARLELAALEMSG